MHELNKKIKEKVISSQSFRMELAMSSFYYFFHIYFSHYISCDSALFHRDLAHTLENVENKFLAILGYRGSAKSTYATLAFPIFSILRGWSHLALIISDTGMQVRDHLYNITNELENNKLLIHDFGPFNLSSDYDVADEWNKHAMIVPKYDAKITGRSMGQKVRGLRYKQYRPDLVIADDIENIETVQTREQRNKTYTWYKSEVLLASDEGAKDIIIGNLLHKDCTLARIIDEIREGERTGIVKKYPLMKDGKIYWKGKYPDMEAIEEKRKKVSDNRIWQREYQLKIIAEEDQIIKDEWIQYYDDLYPEESLSMSGTGIDLAISKRATADYTAMVSGRVYYLEEKERYKILIDPKIINKRLSFHETLQIAHAQSLYIGDGSPSQLFVEQVAYQQAAIEEMKRRMMLAEPILPGGQDKSARLSSIASFIEDGTILFPRHGAEDLITQLVGFGIEKHDDISDALVILILGFMKNGLYKYEVDWL